MSIQRARPHNNVGLIMRVLGLSDAEVAERTGASVVHVSKVRNGTARPSERFQRLIAYGLGVRPEDVFPPSERRSTADDDRTGRCSGEPSDPWRGADAGHGGAAS